MFVGDLLRAFGNPLPTLREKMRRLVRQRRSDATSTPASIFVVVPPSVFFIIAEEIGATTVRGRQAVCSLESLEVLDMLTPPSENDLKSDDQVHEYYGHSMKSRWYSQHFDLETTEYVEEAGAAVPWTVRQAVCPRLGASLLYDMALERLSVQCVWTGVHKKPYEIPSNPPANPYNRGAHPA